MSEHHITRDQVLTQLRDVIDPELHINIVDLGLIYDVFIDHEQGIVTITMTLTTPGCPLSYVFRDLIPQAVKKIDGVCDVVINLVWEPPWDPDKMSEDQLEELGIIR